MVLEATMIVVDNSESSRNGDYAPTRFEAQADAVNLIFNAKTGSNPESSVGLMSMGGTGPEVLTTLTTDAGKVLDGLHRTKIKGSAHFSTGINVAALALKHRQNKSQRQRIIVFTCSPIDEDGKSLTRLAKKMKKGGVSIDIIAFGEPDDETVKKLREFNEVVTGSDGSFFEVISPSPNLLSDTLLSTTLLQNEGVGGGMGPSGGASGGAGGDTAMDNGQFEFGFNPELDPELALALRMSMEEEKARQEREKKKEEDAQSKEKLEGIPEDGEESKPLLENQEESADASGSSKKDDKKEDGGDKMDTA